MENNTLVNYLEELNKPQADAVLSTEGPSIIIAGAGSGKTRVLTYRIAHLMKLGVPPSKILALTFTNKAAREMKSRIETVVGESSKYLWMGTFHSIFARILRIEADTIGYPSNFTIYDASDSKNVIKSIVKNKQLDEKTYKAGVIAGRISAAKNGLVTPALYLKNTQIKQYDASIHMPLIGEIYKEYDQQCFLSGAMDFDDLLMKTNILFHDHIEILEKYQQKFNYILVDEYQDTNYSQYLIVKNLAMRHNNICVVGDDAQSIYSFRGARIENILNFQKDYPRHNIFKLERNYRSTRTIVNAANSIIRRNKKQIPKNVFSEKEEGHKIRFIHALTDNEEGLLVANEVGESRMRFHYKYQDFAILYRTNAQSRIFEESLRRRNIPYKIFGGLSFYQRKEIKDILAYFRLIINTKDNEALRRIINYPARGIGDSTLNKLEIKAIEKNASIFNIILEIKITNLIDFNRGIIEKLINFASLINPLASSLYDYDAYELAGMIVTQSGLVKDLHKDQSPEGLSRFENIQELLNGIQEFTINAREEGLPNTLAHYMEEVALLTDQDTEKDEDRDKVTMMTVHSSKGLEFKNVFIVGMEENLFPSLGNAPTQESFEEERRLFYVALTRAQENVWLTCARQRYKWGKLEFCNPSRFISEIDPEYLELSQKNNYFPDIEDNMSLERKFNNLHVSKPVDSSILSGKLMKLREAKKQTLNADGDDPRDIKAGMIVEHQRFGQGKVLQTEGSFPNLKAVVFFQNVGQKQLLLKFAKLKIVK